jgi:hypothetical protein
VTSGKYMFQTFFQKTVISSVHCWFTDDFVETLTERQIIKFWL